MPLLTGIALLPSLMLASGGEPALAFSTYLGGSDTEQAGGIAVDAEGNVYVTGRTWSGDFPSTGSPISSRWSFVTKFNSTGTAMLYSTLLGDDTPACIAVDSHGNAYVVGRTGSRSFAATPGAWRTSHGGGESDAYLLKLSADGSQLLYATYFGGEDNDEATGLAVDAAGNAYVAGVTSSSDLGLSPSIKPSAAGGSRAFIAKFDPTGAAVVYLVLLGGRGNDAAAGLALGPDGAAYVTGRASSADFPLANPWQASLRGSANAFVARLNPAGNALVYSTFLGGSTIDAGAAIALDAAGNVYLTGTALSDDFPVLNAAQPAHAGYHDAFVAKLDAAGALVYSTYLGGQLDEFAGDIAVDPAGNALVIGTTDSSDLPTLHPLRPANDAYWNTAFLGRFDPAGARSYATYFGSNRGNDSGVGIATDANGNACFTGTAEHPFDRPLPVTPRVAQGERASPAAEVFVAKLAELRSPPANDSFAGRFPLAGTRLSTLGSNIGASSEAGEPAHGGPGGKSVWWSWTAPADGNLTVSTEGSDFDTLLAVYSGSAWDALVLAASNDDVGEALTTSRVKLRVSAGAACQIVVDGKNGAAGHITLTLELGVPANDDFAQAATLQGLPATAEGSNVRSTVEPGEPAHAGATPSTSVWWSWLSPASGFVTVTAQRSDLAPLVAVYSGDSLDRLTPVASAFYFSRLTFAAEAGVNYRIAVAGYYGASGHIVLDILPAVRPPNDDFASRTPLSGYLVVTNGSNFDATTEPGEPGYPGIGDEWIYSGGSTVWWSWVAPTNGSVLISTAGTLNDRGSVADTRLAVFTGSRLEDLKLVALNNNANPAAGLYTSRLILTNIVAGTAYQILYDTVSWERPGPCQLSLSVIQPPRLSAAELADGVFRFRVTGTLEQPYVLETTTSLSGAAPWAPLSTNTVGAAGVVDFADPRPGGSTRFYRAVEAQSPGN